MCLERARLADVCHSFFFQSSSARPRLPAMSSSDSISPPTPDPVSGESTLVGWPAVPTPSSPGFVLPETLPLLARTVRECGLGMMRGAPKLRFARDSRWPC